jgi:hypothetical protein
MITKRRRAPGGGRKRLGRSVAQNLTIRIDDDLREQLEAVATARQKRNWNLSQEILLRLRISLNNEREEQRSPAMRALCFLIAQLADHVVGPKMLGEGKEVAIYNWRADPFFYRAFKIAVGQLLDALEPPGPIKAYPIKITREDGPDLDIGDYEAGLDPSLRRYLETFETPEARAQYSIDYVLTAFRGFPQWSAEVREEQRKLVTEYGFPTQIREFYGMPDAARDLAVKPRSDERVRINVKMNEIAGLTLRKTKKEKP